MRKQSYGALLRPLPCEMHKCACHSVCVDHGMLGCCRLMYLPTHTCSYAKLATLVLPNMVPPQVLSHTAVHILTSVDFFCAVSSHTSHVSHKCVCATAVMMTPSRIHFHRMTLLLGGTVVAESAVSIAGVILLYPPLGTAKVGVYMEC